MCCFRWLGSLEGVVVELWCEMFNFVCVQVMNMISRRWQVEIKRVSSTCCCHPFGERAYDLLAKHWAVIVLSQTKKKIIDWLSLAVSKCCSSVLLAACVSLNLNFLVYMDLSDPNLVKDDWCFTLLISSFHRKWFSSITNNFIVWDDLGSLAYQLQIKFKF